MARDAEALIDQKLRRANHEVLQAMIQKDTGVLAKMMHCPHKVFPGTHHSSHSTSSHTVVTII